MFLIEFRKSEVVDSVLQCGLWSFGGHLLVMIWLKPGDSPYSLSFQEADFWVHILNVALEWFNHRMAEWLARRIGKPVSVEYHEATIRVHFTSDITLPL